VDELSLEPGRVLIAPHPTETVEILATPRETGDQYRLRLRAPPHGGPGTTTLTRGSSTTNDRSDRRPSSHARDVAAVSMGEGSLLLGRCLVSWAGTTGLCDVWWRVTASCGLEVGIVRHASDPR
jgi:hypothetical protein